MLLWWPCRCYGLPLSLAFQNERNRVSRHCKRFLFRFSACDNLRQRGNVYQETALVRLKDDGECVFFIHCSDPTIVVIRANHYTAHPEFYHLAERTHCIHAEPRTSLHRN